MTDLELGVVVKEALDFLVGGKGLDVVTVLSGRFLSALDTNGVSLTLLWNYTEELLEDLSYPSVQSSMFTPKKVNWQTQEKIDANAEFKYVDLNVAEENCIYNAAKLEWEKFVISEDSKLTMFKLFEWVSSKEEYYNS
jgi:hypothetical protein